MFLTISKSNTAFRLAVALHAAATTTEAMAFYAEIGAAALTTGKAIAHTIAYLATLAALGLSLAWGWVRDEWPRLVEAGVGAWGEAGSAAKMQELSGTFRNHFCTPKRLETLALSGFGLKNWRKVRRF